MQYFKGDAQELKVDAGGTEIMDAIGAQLDLFFDECYEAYPLGDVLFESGRTPLANAIPQDIFRSSFPAIYDAFVAAGTFEAYLFVFEQIFGSDVTVTFTVPAAGKLNIDILAAGIELNNFASREIEENEFVYSDIIEELHTDEIMFQTIVGFKSQYELEQMLYEMVPAGVFTVISLDLIGG